MDNDYLSNFLQNLHSEMQLEKFLVKRINLVKENKYPVQINSEIPFRYLTHIIPDNYENIHLDLAPLEELDNHFLINANGEGEPMVPDFNFDGIMFCTSLHSKRGYTQVFRDGRVETVNVPGAYHPEKGNTISLLKMQANTLFRTKRYLKILEKLGLNGSYKIYFRWLGLENTKLDPKDISQSGFDSKGHNKAISMDEFIFPSISIASGQSNVEEILKPLFNIFWNIFGFPRAPDVQQEIIDKR